MEHKRQKPLQRGGQVRHDRADCSAGERRPLCKAPRGHVMCEVLPAVPPHRRVCGQRGRAPRALGQREEGVQGRELPLCLCARPLLCAAQPPPNRPTTEKARHQPAFREGGEGGLRHSTHTNQPTSPCASGSQMECHR